MDRCDKTVRGGTRCKNAAVPTLSKCPMHIESAETGDAPDATTDGPVDAENAAQGVDVHVEPEFEPEPEPDTRPVWERQREELLGGGA